MIDGIVYKKHVNYLLKTFQFIKIVIQ